MGIRARGRRRRRESRAEVGEKKGIQSGSRGEEGTRGEEGKEDREGDEKKRYNQKMRS
jgi:hypothetical protein